MAWFRLKASSRLLTQPPASMAATPGKAAKAFHKALMRPDMACCWPSAEARPLSALLSMRKALVSKGSAISRRVKESGVKAKIR